MRGLASLLTTLLLGAHAQAQDPGEARDPDEAGSGAEAEAEAIRLRRQGARFDRRRGDFWLALEEPEYERSRYLLADGRRARRNARLAEDTLDPRRREADQMRWLRRAIQRFQLAHELLPSDPEAHFEFADTMTTAAHRAPALAEAAIALLEQLREGHPEFRANEVAFHLGSLYSSRLDVERAAQEYERAIAATLGGESPAALASSDPIGASTILSATGNWAEMQMLEGRLEDAVATYERAITMLRAGGGLGASLAYWGLAVALDRMGYRARALEAIGRALQLASHWSAARGGASILDSSMGFHALRAPGVSYAPAEEILYYDALGLLGLEQSCSEGSHEPLLLDACGAEPREERLLGAARQKLLHFLRLGAEQSPFLEPARRRLEEIERRLEASPARRRPRRRRG